MLIEKDKIFINVVNELSRMSKCTFTQVAAVCVDEHGRIKATGVNGTQHGVNNCCETHFEQREDHKEWSDKYEIHAELNMITDMARSGWVPDGPISVYVNINPCFNCLKHILGLNNKKIKVDKIVFGQMYHRTTAAEMGTMIQYAKSLGTELYQYVGQ